MKKKQLFLSVIIPVYNSTQHLEKCITAIMKSSYSYYEVIVVDDASTDNSAEIACKHGAKVFRLSRQSGPAAARNLGAKKARGEILLFIDADVMVQQGTVARVANNFQKNQNIAALFGSYDDTPAENNFVSQYKNLSHHFVHQQSKKDAATFWAGCGAVRREIFDKVDNFDQRRYPKPAIEDIELGYRIKKIGYNILLDKELQVKHLKKWTFVSMLRADIIYRAIPWSKLMLENRNMHNDLNLRTSDRISAGLVGLSCAIIPFLFFKAYMFCIIFLSLLIIFVLNYKLYRFFIKRKGLRFTVLAFPMHIIHYFYSGITFVLCWSIYRFKEVRFK